MATGTAAHVVRAAVSTFVLAVTACGSSYGAAERCADVQSDDANCGACGNVCPIATYCSAGACAPGCRDRIVYVSPSGNDANTGCSPGAPRRSIVGAIGFVKSLAATDYAVQACRGTYDETRLVIERPVALRGGYDCATWRRSTDYGYPAFESANETVIENADVGAQEATLVVGGSDTDIISVDGVTVRGRDADKTAFALKVQSAVDVTLSNNRILARKGRTTDATFSAGSVGLALSNGARAVVKENVIDGGDGDGANVGHGSAGIYAVSIGAARFERNRVTGGAGRGSATFRYAAMGIEVFRSKGVQIFANEVLGIRAGSGPETTSGFGVEISESEDVGVTGNTIDAGRVGLGNTGTFQIGVAVQGSTRARVTQNRISAGAMPSGAGLATLIGVFVGGGTETRVIDNFVHAGTSQSAASGHIGVIVSKGAASALIAHNTVVASASTSYVGVAVEDSAPLLLANLFVGGRQPSGAANAMTLLCGGPGRLPTLQRNAFLNFPTGILTIIASGSCVASVALTMELAETRLNQLRASSALGNLRVNESCLDDAQCIVRPGCTGAPECPAAIFQSWDVPSNGRATLDTGYLLGPNTPCRIAQGGAPLPEVPADFFSTTRSLSTSLGAHQTMVGCVP